MTRHPTSNRFKLFLTRRREFSISSWPGIAVRRTASLPLAYVPAIHVLLAVMPIDVDARDKRGHDDRASHRQHRRARGLARGEIGVGLCGVLQRIGLVHLDLH